MTGRHARAPARSKGPRARAGFTLIEILVAMMIFLVGMTGVLALMSTALSLHRDGLVAGRTTRELDALPARLQAELSAGVHQDADDAGRLVDVDLGRLDEGTVYSVQWVLQPDGEGVLALVSVAGHENDLRRARPIPYLLTLAPRDEDAVDAWRARRTRMERP